MTKHPKSTGLPVAVLDDAGRVTLPDGSVLIPL
jgi:hypothetical protein